MKTKSVSGMVKILKALMYKEHMIYARMIGKDYFEYLLSHEGQIYSGYIIMKPRKGKNGLSQEEIAASREIIFAGGMSTVDELIGDKISSKEKEIVEVFEQNRKKLG